MHGHRLRLGRPSITDVVGSLDFLNEMVECETGVSVVMGRRTAAALVALARARYGLIERSEADLAEHLLVEAVGPPN